jgi:thiol-disulfide isomerase/thioredoxin
MRKITPLALIGIIALLTCAANAAQTGQNNTAKNVTMYYFWQTNCPHCKEIEPFIGTLETKYPQLELKRFEVRENRENSQLFYETAEAYGKQAKITPTVFVGDYMIEGYNGWITEQRIDSAIINCTEKKCSSPGQKLQDYKNNQTTTTTTQTTTTNKQTSTTPTTTTITSSTTQTTTTTTTTSTTTTTAPIVSTTQATTTTTTTSTTTQATTTTAPPATTIPQPEKKDITQILAPAAIALLALSALLIQRTQEPKDLTKKT